MNKIVICNNEKQQLFVSDILGNGFNVLIDNEIKPKKYYFDDVFIVNIGNNISDDNLLKANLFNTIGKYVRYITIPNNFEQLTLNFK